MKRKTVEIDALDRKILAALDADSRRTFRDIGRAVRASEETVRYRFHRLQSRGVIAHVPAVVAATRLGYTYTGVFLKLQNASLVRRRALIAYLTASPTIAWVAELEGSYDVACILMTRGHATLHAFVLAFTREFGDIVLSRRVVINLQGEFFPRSYLNNSQRLPQTIAYQPDLLSLTDREHAICAILAHDARTPALDIARQLSVAVDTVITTMRSLIERGVLARNVLIINNEYLGQVHHKILLSVRAIVVEPLLAFCRLHPRVISLVQALGEHDYEIDVEVDALTGLRSFLIELTSVHADAIRDYSVLRILSMPKYVFFPD